MSGTTFDPIDALGGPQAGFKVLYVRTQNSKFAPSQPSQSSASFSFLQKISFSFNLFIFTKLCASHMDIIP